MQQVCRRVITTDLRSPPRINIKTKRLTHSDAVILDLNIVYDKIAGLLMARENARNESAVRHSPHPTSVAYLTARLRIEGCLIQYDFPTLPRPEFGVFGTTTYNGLHYRFSALRLVSEKLRSPVLFTQRKPIEFCLRIARADPRRARLDALPVHR